MSRAALFILGPASPDDPLDCVAAATPFLAPHYDAIHQVGPGQSLSVRSMRRMYKPGTDRLLYDFTAPADHAWSMETLAQSPGSVLLAGTPAPAPTGVLSSLRSAQRYASGGFRFPPTVTVGAFKKMAEFPDASIVQRPAATIPEATPADDLALSVAPREIETAYAALLGLVGAEASVVIITSARRDANDLSEITDALQLTSTRVRYVRSRKDISAAASGAQGLIDVTGPGQGLSDEGFVAQCVGAPVLSLTSPDGATQLVADFAEAMPVRDATAAREFATTGTIEAFAQDLHALIETGYRRALTGVAA